jgi:hypothetical protein
MGGLADEFTLDGYMRVLWFTNILLPGHGPVSCPWHLHRVDVNIMKTALITGITSQDGSYLAGVRSANLQILGHCRSRLLSP